MLRLNRNCYIVRKIRSNSVCVLMLAADAVLKYCISLVTVQQVNDQAAKLLLLFGWC